MHPYKTYIYVELGDHWTNSVLPILRASDLCIHEGWIDIISAENGF